MALKYDKRTYFQYYLSLTKINHILLFIIIPSNDYNSHIIKICIFLFSFAQYFAIKAIFFNESTMHNIYIEKGSYDFIYQLPQIIYSLLITSFINTIIKYFSLSTKEIIGLKQRINKNNAITERKKLMNCLIIKFIIFYIFSFLLLDFFWFYLSCFCAVYKNTQIYLIKDTLIGFLFTLIYPLAIFLFPAIFRIAALRDKKKKKECLYKLSLLLQIL